MTLSDRQKAILHVVVDQYIKTAEPVGSKTIASQAELEVSSATIRNEMAELEHMGLLEQPHTSAGRVPSAEGYRFYVNNLMDNHRLTLQETKSMNEALELKIQEMDQVITQAGKIISQLTQYPTFALTTGRDELSINRFDLLLVDQNSFIVVVMTNQLTVKNKLFRLDKEITEMQLQMLSTLINSSFTGKTTQELASELMRIANHATDDTYELICMVVSFAGQMLKELQNSGVHTAGIQNLLAHPEYQSLDSAGPLMNFLSEWENTTELPVIKDGDVEILIGPENVASELKNSSIVMARYDIGDNMQGVIGVVGPTRMDYAKLAARLSYFAEGLSRMFGKGELPQSNSNDENKGD